MNWWRMVHRSLAVVAVVVTVLTVGCGDDGSSASGAAPPVAFDSAAVLAGAVPTVGGGTVDLGDFAGADLVVWFWAPW
jgi:hypothetical protein